MSSLRSLPLRERARRNAAVPGHLNAAKRGDEHAFMVLYALRAEQAGLCAALGLPEHEVGPTLVQVFREVWHSLPRCDATRAVEFDAWLLEILCASVCARRGDEVSARFGWMSGVWELPAALRNVILLREVFGHPLGDVSSALGDSESTVQLW